jgi:hypothetical protein
VKEPSEHAQGGEGSFDLGGYRQQLKRTLVSFHEVVQGARPVGIWLWVLVLVGHAPVALGNAPC